MTDHVVEDCNGCWLHLFQLRMDIVVKLLEEGFFLTAMCWSFARTIRPEARRSWRFSSWFSRP